MRNGNLNMTKGWRSSFTHSSFIMRQTSTQLTHTHTRILQTHSCFVAIIMGSRMLTKYITQHRLTIFKSPMTFPFSGLPPTLCQHITRSYSLFTFCVALLRMNHDNNNRSKLSIKFFDVFVRHTLDRFTPQFMIDLCRVQYLE